MTIEELLISKGVIDKDWNFLESGNDNTFTYLYRLTSTKHYSLVIICSILIAISGKLAYKGLDNYKYSINKNWFAIGGLESFNILVADHARENAITMLGFIDGITLIRVAEKMMKETIWK